MTEAFEGEGSPAAVVVGFLLRIRARLRTYKV
jgi:hypothetical protein